METDEQALWQHFAPLFDAEFRRLGFTEADCALRESGDAVTREELEAGLTNLRSLSTGMGAAAYFARLGIIWDDVRRDAAGGAS